MIVELVQTARNNSARRSASAAHGTAFVVAVAVLLAPLRSSRARPRRRAPRSFRKCRCVDQRDDIAGAGRDHRDFAVELVAVPSAEAARRLVPAHVGRARRDAQACLHAGRVERTVVRDARLVTRRHADLLVARVAGDHDAEIGSDFERGDAVHARVHVELCRQRRIDHHAVHVVVRSRGVRAQHLPALPAIDGPQDPRGPHAVGKRVHVAARRIDDRRDLGVQRHRSGRERPRSRRRPRCVRTCHRRWSSCRDPRPTRRTRSADRRDRLRCRRRRGRQNRAR